jgi:hypothetical protein
MKSMPIKTRKHAGARPTFYGVTMIRRTVRLTPKQWEYLKNKYPNPSAGIRDIVEYSIAHDLEE